MEKVKITNLKIIEKASPVGTNNAAFFYMLFNNDEPNESQHKVFFAFANKVKENWEILNSSYENLKEIEIEYEPSEKGNKVVNIIDYTVSI